jgi:adenine-specific DNA-methyltransferase
VLQELFRLGAVVLEATAPDESTLLAQEAEAQKKKKQVEVSQRNLNYYEAEVTKLDGWAEDQKVALERDIKDYDKQIREVKRAAITALALEEKLEQQKLVRKLEQERNDKRRALFDAQDAIDKRRGDLIDQVEGKLKQTLDQSVVFNIQWSLK